MHAIRRATLLVLKVHKSLGLEPLRKGIDFYSSSSTNGRKSFDRSLWSIYKKQGGFGSQKGTHDCPGLLSCFFKDKKLDKVEKEGNAC